MNDFDETLPGPFEWDLKRLVASVVLACRERGFSEAVASDAVLGAVRAPYRGHIDEYAEMCEIEVWYARVAAEDLLAALPRDGHQHWCQGTTTRASPGCFASLSPGRVSSVSRRGPLDSGPRRPRDGIAREELVEDYRSTLWPSRRRPVRPLLLRARRAQGRRRRERRHALLSWR